MSCCGRRRQAAVATSCLCQRRGVGLLERRLGANASFGLARRFATCSQYCRCPHARVDVRQQPCSVAMLYRGGLVRYVSARAASRIPLLAHRRNPPTEQNLRPDCGPTPSWRKPAQGTLPAPPPPPRLILPVLGCRGRETVHSSVCFIPYTSMTEMLRRVTM